MSDYDDIDTPEDGHDICAGNGSGDDDNGPTGPGKRRDYEVGYGKPPTSTRWPKGKSGNPRGPKKGSRGLKKDLHKALSLPHSIKADGRIVKGTTQEMAMFTLAKRAGTGDLRAIRELVDLTLKIFGTEDRGRDRATMSPQDQELLARLLGRDPDEDEGETDAGDAGDLDDNDPEPVPVPEPGQCEGEEPL
jgi:hypothetical protein